MSLGEHKINPESYWQGSLRICFPDFELLKTKKGVERCAKNAECQCSLCPAQQGLMPLSLCHHQENKEIISAIRVFTKKDTQGNGYRAQTPFVSSLPLGKIYM